MNHKDKYNFYIYFFRCFFVIVLLYSIFNDNLYTVVPSFFSLFIGFLSRENLGFLDRIKILQIIIVSFFISFFLLIIMDFFPINLWWWDLMLHTLFGFMLGFLGYILIFLLDKDNKSYILIALFVIMFSVFSGFVWESYAYISDLIVKSEAIRTLDDTITDMMADAVGGSIACLYVIFRLRKSI